MIWAFLYLLWSNELTVMTYRHLSLIRDTLTYQMLSPLMVTLTHMYNIWLSSKVGLVNTTKTIDVPPKHSSHVQMHGPLGEWYKSFMMLSDRLHCRSASCTISHLNQPNCATHGGFPSIPSIHLCQIQQVEWMQVAAKIIKCAIVVSVARHVSADSH